MLRELCYRDRDTPGKEIFNNTLSMCDNPVVETRSLPGVTFRERSVRSGPIFCLFLLIFFLSPFSAVSSPKSIRIVMDNNYPPFTFLDSTGKLQGILIDQWALWEKKTGIRAEVTGMDWGSAQQKMEAGQYDVIDTLFHNEKRAMIYDFSQPYQNIDVPIFFHENISGIRDVASLAGFAVAVKKGDNAIDYLKRHGIDTLIEYNSYEAIIDAAKEHRALIFVVDKPPALYFLYKKGIHREFNHSKPLYTGSFHRAVQKGNTALLKTVEDGFAAISPVEYHEIEERWYGSKEFPVKYLRWVALAVAFIAALILFLMTWNRALRRAVRRKTAELEKEIRISQERADALKESEERFALFLEHCPIFVFLKDENNRAIAVSRSFEKMLGRPLDEILGRTSEELFPPDLARKIRADDEDVLKAGSVKTLEEELGGRTYITCKFPLYRPDKPPVLGGFTIDITERMQYEAALKRSEQRYRDLVDNAESIILRFDNTGKILFMNPFGLHLFGYTEEEILGRNVVGTIVPETESTTSRDLSLLLKEIEADPDRFKNNENENMKKNGGRIWVSWTNRAIWNEAGEHEVLSIGNNITEKKMLERRLFQAQKMEAVGTLAGGIAHDFNNLLMGIMGYTSVMLFSTDPSDPDYEKLKSIEEQIKSGAGLTRQLLGFARGGKYEVKPADINEIVNASIDMFGRTRKEIAVHKKLGKDLGIVDVDRSQIEQVFLNLFVNAWQAMPAGGNLFIETALKRFDDAGIVPREGTYIAISVIDTGIGMDEKTLTRIFDPFFTTKESGMGSGLGLASVYGIIKNHQGAITVESTPGKGSRFDIFLPASQNTPLGDEPQLPHAEPGSGTILIVEDQPAVAQTACEMLKALGYAVHIAESGIKAIELFSGLKDSIDLVILDMIMPGMSGGETYELLKRIRPDIKVILSSGYSIDGQAAQIMEKGCNAFLQKPFSINELSAKVQEVLKRN